MSLLILHRNPFEPFPYLDWLADYPGDIVVLAARDKFALFGEPVPEGDQGFTRLELCDDYDGEAVTARALELAEEYDVQHIVAHHEADLVRAAALRERLGLEGAWSADVEPFRDKALMKRLARKAGIPIAPHIAPGTAAAARAFAATHGFPVVFKDRTGYNSIGLRIPRDQNELERHLAEAFPGGRPRDDVLMEAYVAGRMCHVDGLVIDGEVAAAWPSQYQYELSSFAADPGPRVDLTLDVDDPLTPRLLELTERTLKALTPERTRLPHHAFHAEVFHTPDDRLVLCEIACRSGGAKIREVFRTLFGVRLAEFVTRAEAGLPLPAPPPRAADGSLPRPRCMAGQVLTMKRPGLVRSLPEVPDDPWVAGFWRYAEVGQVIAPAAGSADFLTAAVASAPDRAACERRLRALGERVRAATRIVEAP